MSLFIYLFIYLNISEIIFFLISPLFILGLVAFYCTSHLIASVCCCCYCCCCCLRPDIRRIRRGCGGKGATVALSIVCRTTMHKWMDGWMDEKKICRPKLASINQLNYSWRALRSHSMHPHRPPALSQLQSSFGSCTRCSPPLPRRHTTDGARTPIMLFCW